MAKFGEMPWVTLARRVDKLEAMNNNGGIDMKLNFDNLAGAVKEVRAEMSQMRADLDALKRMVRDMEADSDAAQATIDSLESELRSPGASTGGITE